MAICRIIHVPSFIYIKNILKTSIALARVNFKIQNEGTYLGSLWYILNPLLLYALLLFVFSNILGSAIPAYPLYLLIGVIIFNLFRHTTIESSDAIYQNRGLIKSLSFPREILILSIILKNLFNHLFEIAILFVFLPVFGISIFHIAGYFLFLILFIPYIYGTSLFLASVRTRIFDLTNIWIFFSQLLWFATPIFYTIPKDAILLHFMNMLNPLFYFTETGRSILIYGGLPDAQIISGALASSFLFLFFGVFIYKKLSPRFSEIF